MAIQDIEQLISLSKELADTLVTASYFADKIRSILRIEEQGLLPEPTRSAPGRRGERNPDRPVVDQSTFSVSWQGKSLHLGHTRSFWLLARLARRPNQYVTHLELITEVWDADDELTTATIRSTVCQLRRRLRMKRMSGLAAAIRGHNGHYMLAL